MLKRTTWISLTTLLLTSFFLFTYLLYLPEKTSDITRTLTHKTTTKKKNTPTKQMRSKVSKDIWIAEENSRLHHRIESPRSILTAYPRGDKTELIEQMIGMKCYLQEKVEGKENLETQQIRYIESEEGSYHYANQHFDAQSVFLAVFRIPGETLQTKLNLEEAYLKGVAEEVSLTFSDRAPDFHAKKFKAHIRPQRTSLP